MKITVNKAISKTIDYKEGDVISLGNLYTVKHYLLIKGSKGEVGAINLKLNELEYYYPSTRNLEDVVNDILENHDWDEWTLIDSENVNMTLNCNGDIGGYRQNSHPVSVSSEPNLSAELF